MVYYAFTCYVLQFQLIRMTLHRGGSIIITLIGRRCSIKLFFCFAWFGGLLLGFLTAVINHPLVIFQQNSISLAKPSIISYLSVLFLPYLLGSLISSYLKPIYCFLFVFVRAFLFGFVYFYISCSFGNADWLARILIMFADTASVVFLLQVMLRNLIQKGIRTNSILYYVAPILVIGLFDYLFVTPIAVLLID